MMVMMTDEEDAACYPLDRIMSKFSIRVGSYSLLLGIFPTQGSNLCLLHCRQILYHLSHIKEAHRAE